MGSAYYQDKDMGITILKITTRRESTWTRLRWNHNTNWIQTSETKLLNHVLNKSSSHEIQNTKLPLLSTIKNMSDNFVRPHIACLNWRGNHGIKILSRDVRLVYGILSICGITKVIYPTKKNLTWYGKVISNSPT